MRALTSCRATRTFTLHFASLLQSRTYRTSIRVSDEVRDAVATNKPVVALESTIYTHGFPYPENINLALHLESIVRRNGAVPATVGVLDGEATVGLTLEELTRLIEAARRKEVMKVSRRDLAFTCGSAYRKQSLLRHKLHGGTTVSGTMLLAHLAGVDILATGGIGGVHRGAESSMDVSADLTELGRTSIAVISSGCKSFLDIPRTLEYLETQGVAVGTFHDGEHDEVDFPAFWSKESGVRSPSIIKSGRHAAAMIHAQKSLPVSSGLLLANPIPEESSISKANLDAFIERAISDAEENGYTGKRNTPYILARMKELSKGDTVIANRALIQANVRMGAIVAKELALIRNFDYDNASRAQRNINSSANTVSFTLNHESRRESPYTTARAERQVQSEGIKNSYDVLVVGSVALDFDCQHMASNDAKQISPELHTSNPSKISQNVGGVGYNVARAVQVAGSPVRLVSAVGADPAGRHLLSCMKNAELHTDGVRVIQGANTSLYISFNNEKKDLIMATSDMRIFNEGNASLLDLRIANSENVKPSWVVIDANWSSSKIREWLEEAKKIGARTAFEPVSLPKASRIFGNNNTIPVFPTHLVDVISPNKDELSAIYNAARSLGIFERDDWWQIISSFGLSSSGNRDALIKNSSAAIVDAGFPQQCLHLLPIFPTIAMKLGSDGLLLTMLLKAGDARLEPAHKSSQWVLRSASDMRNSSNSGVGGIYIRKFAAAEIIPINDIVSVNGIGDTFLGTLVAKLAQNDEGAEEFIEVAQQAAVKKLKCQSPFNTGYPD